jgi:hypothetical protein
MSGFNCEDTGSDTAVVFSSETVQPGDDTVPSTLYCKSGRCPHPSVIDTTSDTKTPYDTLLATQEGVTPDQANYDTYTFDTGAYTMTFQSGQAVNRTVEDTTSTWQFGVRSAALFLEGDSPSLACDFDTGSTCGWEASNLDEYYIWETGHRVFNRLIALKNTSTGDYLELEQPLNVQYQTEEGSTYRLRYRNFGDLTGFPFECVDPNTGKKTSCSSNARWVPTFNIPNGDTVTKVSNPDKEVFVKQLSVEQRMKRDKNACSSLSTKSLDLPKLDGWTDPALGPKPGVDSAPAVVDGTVQ